MSTVLVLKSPVYLDRNGLPTTILHLTNTNHVEFIKLLQKGQPFVNVSGIEGSIRAIPMDSISAVYDGDNYEIQDFPEVQKELDPGYEATTAEIALDNEALDEAFVLNNKPLSKVEAARLAASLAKKP